MSADRIAKQVAAWRDEVDRLSGMIAHAEGRAMVPAQTERPASAAVKTWQERAEAAAAKIRWIIEDTRRAALAAQATSSQDALDARDRALEEAAQAVAGHNFFITGSIRAEDKIRTLRATPATTPSTDAVLDAARYKFLRKGFGGFGPDVDLHNAFVDGDEKMDAAIDAAIAAAKEAT